MSQEFVSIFASIVSLLSTLIALFIALYKPRTKLNMSAYKTNYSGLERINALSQVKIHLRFCLLNKDAGSFKLKRVIYYHVPLISLVKIPKYKTYSIQLYGYNKNKLIDRLPSTNKFEKLKSLIVVSNYNPVIEMTFNFSELYSLMTDNDIRLNDPRIFYGKLVFYFKTTDRYRRYIKVIIGSIKYKEIHKNVMYLHHLPHLK